MIHFRASRSPEQPLCQCEDQKCPLAVEVAVRKEYERTYILDKYPCLRMEWEFVVGDAG